MLFNKKRQPYKKGSDKLECFFLLQFHEYESENSWNQLEKVTKVQIR
jgi:hypothetical protein